MRLADGTAFTATANAHFVLDTFAYDTAPTLKGTACNLLKGAFRYTSWKLGMDPRKFTLPSGVCGGIRGTDFMVELDPDDTALVSLVDGGIGLVDPSGKPLLDMKPGQRVGVYGNGRVERIPDASAGQLELLWHCLAAPEEEQPAPLWSRPGTWGIVVLVLGALFGGIAIWRRVNAGRTA